MSLRSRQCTQNHGRAFSRISWKNQGQSEGWLVLTNAIAATEMHARILYNVIYRTAKCTMRQTLEITHNAPKYDSDDKMKQAT